MLPALFRPGSHAPCPLPARQPWGSSPERVPGSSMSSFVSYFMESLFLIFFISSQNVGLEFSDMHSLFLYPFPSLQWTGNSLRFCNNRCGSNSSRTQRINQGIQITVSLVKRLNLFSPTWLEVSLLLLKIVQVWWILYSSSSTVFFFFNYIVTNNICQDACLYLTLCIKC